MPKRNFADVFIGANPLGNAPDPRKQIYHTVITSLFYGYNGNVGFPAAQL